MARRMALRFLCFIFFVFGEGNVTVTERNALMDLYNSTQGQNWNNHNGWTTGDPCALPWNGVTCKCNQNDCFAILTLSLAYNGLNGTIPASIGNLSSLQTLDLTHNLLLSGTIPASIGNLSSLQLLYLDDNNLSGSIPASIGNLFSLTDLHLYVNQLSGTIPASIGNLSSLKYMDLYSNNLSGTIPASIGNLFSLIDLELYSNQLSGTIPASIGNLFFLTNLYLHYNQLSGTIPASIGNLPFLNDLELNNNQLSGTIPESIGSLSLFQVLILNSNQLSGTIPASIWSLSLLQTLYLYSNQLSGTIPSSIENLTSLTDLELYSNQLSGTIPASIGNLSSLQTLYLQNTQLCGCPHLPSKLQICNLTGNHHSCNCSILPICYVSRCNDSFNCILDVSPLPIPSIQPTPQPIPDVILPIPSIQPTPQPIPDVGCQGNYGTPFTCNDGKWTSMTDVTLNGTNLLQSVYDVPTLFVNGNILFSESIIYIEKNLFILKHSVLTIQNSSIFVNGNLYINSQSTIVLDEVDNFTIHINHCAILNGNLIVKLRQSQIGKRFPILTAQCINGTFSSVIFNFTESPQCYAINDIQYDELSVYFNILSYCPSDTPIWIYITIGIIGFLIVVGIISFAIVIRRKKIKSKVELGKLKLRLGNTTD